MALANINIDDRSYEQLLGVLKQHIPVADWRDHNPSDPGIMLLELLAWLGEMSLYRMNRVPDAHREKFLKLIADPPQPATAMVTFTATLDNSRRIEPPVLPGEPAVSHPLVVPLGTRLATDFNNGRRYVFETLENVSLELPESWEEGDSERVTIEATAREFVIVEDQRIGVSDGTADQVFALEPPRRTMETPDHPPQMSRSVGFSPAIGGGNLGEDSGILDVLFEEDDLEEAHTLTYDAATETLTLARVGGATEAVAVGSDAIEAGETETVDFPSLKVKVLLDDSFDKGLDLTVDSSSVIVTGTGAINPASVTILSVRGMPPVQSSTALTFSRLSTPAVALLSTTDGLNGVVNLSTLGTKTVSLNDQWGRGLELRFDVTTQFDGSETSAVIDVLPLNNLFYLGTLEDVSHSPWSEVLMDFVYRSPEYDPNPQIRVHSGFTPALASGGKLGVDSGIIAVRYRTQSAEEVFLLRAMDGPPRLRLRRPGGPGQTVPIPPFVPGTGTPRMVAFSDFDVGVEVTDDFETRIPITIATASVAVTGGSGAINANTVRIVGARGLPAQLDSPTLTFSNLIHPEAVRISTDGGLSGIVDLSTTGLKIVRLTDVWERELRVRFTVTAAFDGTEESVSIELNALENLLFLATHWKARRSLRDEASHLSDPSEPVRHCLVDAFDRTLRFGDGTFGSIPPAGSEIVASYRVLQGPEALVRRNDLEHLLDPPPVLASEAPVSVTNKDAEGGLRFYAPEARISEALTDLNRTYRLITAEDFERVILFDFNEFDVMAQAAPNVLTPEEVRARRASDPTVRRAVALMNRDELLEEKRGGVAILVLARLDPAEDPDILHDEDVLLPTKQLAVDLDEVLKERILSFIDDRRLITTQPSLVSAQLVAVTLTTAVIVDRGRGVGAMKDTIGAALHDFFDIYSGYFDNGGWPLERSVYRSEVFQFLEGIDGVDHVKSLTLSPADSNLDVPLGPIELPILQKLLLSVNTV